MKLFKLHVERLEPDDDETRVNFGNSSLKYVQKEYLIKFGHLSFIVVLETPLLLLPSPPPAPPPPDEVKP